MIANTLAEADKDTAIHTVVITGNEKLLASGADLNELAASTSDDRVETPRFVAWATIRAFTKPLIAAVEGWCLALRAAKASIRLSDTLNETDHLVAERKHFIQLLGSEDKAEGIAAFLAKRSPTWKGR